MVGHEEWVFDDVSCRDHHEVRPGVQGRGQAVVPSAAERRLLAENARLESELAKTKAVLAVVGKAHALLEILSESAEEQPPRR